MKETKTRVNTETAAGEGPQEPFDGGRNSSSNVPAALPQNS
jgi:hypothetical protein